MSTNGKTNRNKFQMDCFVKLQFNQLNFSINGRLTLTRRTGNLLRKNTYENHNATRYMNERYNAHLKTIRYWELMVSKWTSDTVNQFSFVYALHCVVET